MKKERKKKLHDKINCSHPLSQKQQIFGAFSYPMPGIREVSSV